MKEQDLIQVRAFLLQDIPPVLKAEAQDEDHWQDLPLNQDSDPFKGEGCIHLLELIHVPLPQTIKTEFHSDFM